MQALKNIKFFPVKIFIFTTKTILSILHGHVSVVGRTLVTNDNCFKSFNTYIFITKHI